MIHEVVVVGGGPSGSTIAGLLALRGWRVLLLDRARFPRPKPCGECLSPGAVVALGRLGLLDDVLALEPARLRGWRIRTSRAEAVGRFGDGICGLGVRRTDLDAALLSAARRRGVEVEEGTRVTSVTPATGPGRRPCVDVAGSGGTCRTLQPRIVVGADGLRSVVARSIGAVTRRPRLRKVSITCGLDWDTPLDALGMLHVDDGITLGLAPVHRTERRWNATVVADAERYGAAVSAGPDGFARQVMDARLGQDRGRTIVGGPRASGPFDWPVRRPWASGVILVGDAAGYFDPFTGQGIHRALRTAELAHGAVDRVLQGNRQEDELVAYQKRLEREIAPGRRVQRAIEAVMARPRIRDPILAGLGRSRGLDALVRVTGDIAPVSSLVHPRSWTRAPEAGSAGVWARVRGADSSC